MTLRQRLSPIAAWLAFVQALVSMLGSLYASEILLMPPCSLCWWQRIAWYPLVVVFGCYLLFKEARTTVWTALALSVAGWGFALYQVLLEAKLLPVVAGCEVGIPCDIPQSFLPAPLDWFTIPMMSLVGFTLTLAALWAMWPARGQR